MGKKSLFDENEAVEDTKLNVNESFAKRFEVICGIERLFGFSGEACQVRMARCLILWMSVMQHNKKREELHRLKEKYPEVAARLDAKGVSALEDSDVSSSEEEVSKNQA
jgi:hypothetical protein